MIRRSDSGENEATPRPVCPLCGSTDLARADVPTLLVQWDCRNCGALWYQLHCAVAIIAQGVTP